MTTGSSVIHSDKIILASAPADWETLPLVNSPKKLQPQAQLFSCCCFWVSFLVQTLENSLHFNFSCVCVFKYHARTSTCWKCLMFWPPQCLIVFDQVVWLWRPNANFHVIIKHNSNLLFLQMVKAHVNTLYHWTLIILVVDQLTVLPLHVPSPHPGD